MQFNGWHSQIASHIGIKYCDWLVCCIWRMWIDIQARSFISTDMACSSPTNGNQQKSFFWIFSLRWLVILPKIALCPLHIGTFKTYPKDPCLLLWSLLWYIKRHTIIYNVISYALLCNKKWSFSFSNALYVALTNDKI